MVVVTDEQVAEGLRRSLRSFARVWDLRFARTSGEALAAAGELDAVVCEADQPDAEALLGQLKARFPKVVRTVLAPADLKPDLVARLQSLSHQVMRTPASRRLAGGASFRPLQLSSTPPWHPQLPSPTQMFRSRVSGRSREFPH